METIIEKNQMERYQVGTTRYNGHELFYARLCFQTDDGRWLPTRKGLTPRVEFLPEILKGLQAIEKEARKKGLLG